MKLLTVQYFSEASFMSTMRSVWNPVCEVYFCPIRKNFSWCGILCGGLKVHEEWSVDLQGCGLMLEEFDGAKMILTIMPHMVLAWVQVHCIPYLY